MERRCCTGREPNLQSNWCGRLNRRHLPLFYHASHAKGKRNFTSQAVATVANQIRPVRRIFPVASHRSSTLCTALFSVLQMSQMSPPLPLQIPKAPFKMVTNHLFFQCPLAIVNHRDVLDLCDAHLL